VTAPPVGFATAEGIYNKQIGNSAAQTDACRQQDNEFIFICEREIRLFHPYRGFCQVLITSLLFPEENHCDNPVNIRD
jgi:hypothetical protein